MKTPRDMAGTHIEVMPLSISKCSGALYLLLLLTQLNFAKKAKSERKLIKEGKRRNAFAFQVFLTQRNFLYGEHFSVRFSWVSNTKLNQNITEVRYEIACLVVILGSLFSIAFIRSSPISPYLSSQLSIAFNKTSGVISFPFIALSILSMI